MKCWKCGQENVNGTINCINCGVSLERASAITPVGRAMRELYDRYGCQMILTNPTILKNGLGDFLENTNMNRILRTQIGMVMDAGVGMAYYEQLKKGSPDNTFVKRVKDIITRSCGFGDDVTIKIMGYFDEMIGWKAAERSSVPPNKKPSSVPPNNNKKPSSAPSNNNKKPSSVPPQNHNKTQVVPPVEHNKADYGSTNTMQAKPLSSFERTWLKVSAVLTLCYSFLAYLKNGSDIDQIVFIAIVILMIIAINSPKIPYVSVLAAGVGGFLTGFIWGVIPLLLVFEYFDSSPIQSGSIVVFSLVSLFSAVKTCSIAIRRLDEEDRKRM